MKSRLLSLTLLLFLCGSLFAQNAAKTERMQRREARKARQAMELAQSRAEMTKLVKDTTFVLEANTFIGPFGQESPVRSPMHPKCCLLSLSRALLMPWKWGSSFFCRLLFVSDTSEQSKIVNLNRDSEETLLCPNPHLRSKH